MGLKGIEILYVMDFDINVSFVYFPRIFVSVPRDQVRLNDHRLFLFHTTLSWANTPVKTDHSEWFQTRLLCTNLHNFGDIFYYLVHLRKG